MNRITNYLMGAFLSLFSLSCTNDTYNENLQSKSSDKLKQELQLDEFTNINIAENVEIDWKKATETQKDNFKIFEVPAAEKSASTLESNFLEKYLNYQIVAIESDTMSYSYFIEVYTHKGSNVYPETITKLRDFSGVLNVYLLNGENLGTIAVYNGKARNVSENDNLDVLIQSINAFSSKSDRTGKMPQCGGNYTVIVDQTISRYDVWTVGDKIIAINYIGTTTTRTSTVLPYPCDGQYDKNDMLNQRLELYNFKNSSGIGKLTTIFLDPSFLKNACVSGVYTKLGGSLVFQEYLKRFDGDFSIANLTLTVAKIPEAPNASAVTYQPVNGLIEIRFSPEKLNTPPLNIAKNLAHEILHAAMFEKLLKLSGTKEVPWSEEFIESIRNDEPKIAEYYTRYWYDIPVGGSISDPQHEYMAQLSINTIKDILKQYDNTQSEDVYTAIAWWGLMGVGEPNGITGLPPRPTVAWANIFPSGTFAISKYLHEFY
ncbi:hypothetical protein ACFFWB_15530 [Flavobacterium procerum]|uniref:hypothetical protein n=1 Tax=Flavobacterium procerum TaxID=1455569 RepID=UPI0035E48E23